MLEHLDNIKKLIKFDLEQGPYITGSFLTWMLERQHHGEPNWLPNDLDIVCRSLIQFNQITEILDPLASEIIEPSFSDRPSKHWVINNFKIQVFVHESTVENRLRIQDMTVTEVASDGTNFVTGNTTIDDIKHKLLRYNNIYDYNWSIQNMYERYNKYLGRGYLDTNDETLTKINIKLNSSDFGYIQKDNKNLFKIFSFGSNIDWANSKILDFGCNVGNFINHSKNYIQKKNYVGLDINLPSLEIAKKRFPDFVFKHYDKWHMSYNPNGIKDLAANQVLDEKFDVIILYSVFTHTTISQTRKELDILKTMLTPNGQILFTIWEDKMFQPFIDYVTKAFKLPIALSVRNLKYDTVAYSINHKKVVVDKHDLNIDRCTNLCTYYKIDKFMEIFDDVSLIAYPQDTKIPNHWQVLFKLKNNVK